MKAICRVHDLTLVTQTGRARAFVYGREYDLEESLGGTPLRELLGAYVDAFDPVAPAPAPVMPVIDEGDNQ